MQTIGIKPTSSGHPGPPTGRGKGPAAVLAGLGLAVAGSGAALALTGDGSALRGPAVLFFLVAAPAAAFGHALRGLQAFGRTVVSAAGAVAVDLLVAEGMLATHRWSVRGGVVAVAAISVLGLLFTLVRRARDTTPEPGDI
jgi:hypothetical protein